MKYFNIIVIIMACALISINSQAAAPLGSAQAKPFNVQGAYLLKFGMLPIGVLAIDGVQSGVEYHMKAHAQLVGVAKIFSSHESENEVRGTLADADIRDFAHAKRLFQTHYTSSDGWRTMMLEYDADGALTQEKIEVTHEMSYRPKVPKELKNGVPDTMTMVPVVREMVYAASQNGQKTLSQNIFDGKRLSKVKMQIYGVVNRTWKGVKTPVLKVGLLREPVAGYTEKELKRAAEKPMGELLIYFTANDDFIPILGELSTVFGMFRAELR